QVDELGEKAGIELNHALVNVVDWSETTFGHRIVRRFFINELQQAEGGRMLDDRQEKILVEQAVMKMATRQSADLLRNAIGAVLLHLITFATRTLNGFIYFLACNLLTFYFLLDGARLKDDFLAVLPRSARKTAAALFADVHHVMFSLIRGQLFLGLLSGTYM